MLKTWGEKNLPSHVFDLAVKVSHHKFKQLYT